MSCSRNSNSSYAHQQSANSVMPENKPVFKETLIKKGILYQEDLPNLVLCKPRLMPLKSITMEKVEEMQKEAEKKIRQQSLQQQT